MGWTQIPKILPPTKIVNVGAGSDATVYSPPLRALSIGTVGDVKVKDAEGNDVTIPSNALTAGIQHPMQVSMVYQTGTTASEIVGWR